MTNTIWQINQYKTIPTADITQGQMFEMELADKDTSVA